MVGKVRQGRPRRELAEAVVRTIEKNSAPAIRAVYTFEESLPEKVTKVSQQIYGAGGVRFSAEAEQNLNNLHCVGLRKRWRCASRKRNIP